MWEKTFCNGKSIWEGPEQNGCCCLPIVLYYDLLTKKVSVWMWTAALCCLPLLQRIATWGFERLVLSVSEEQKPMTRIHRMKYDDADVVTRARIYKHEQPGYLSDQQFSHSLSCWLDKGPRAGSLHFLFQKVLTSSWIHKWHHIVI